MFQVNVKGRDIKNLLTLHNKHLQLTMELNEQREEERVNDAKAEQAQAAAAVSAMPPLYRPHDLPVGPIVFKRAAAEMALQAANYRNAIAMNTWLMEQLRDDESYTLDRQDLALLNGIYTRPTLVTPI